MPRGTGMSPTRRRSRKPIASSPEALAALLPDELRSLEGLYTPGDHLSLRGRVVDWLNRIAPGVKASPVMDAAGLSAADFYRHALAMPAQVETWKPPAAPVIDQATSEPQAPTQEDLDRLAARVERTRRTQQRRVVAIR